jgi:DNA invertase Pin-like site-specific DNA recombinase
MRTALYARVSTEEQTEGYSIEAQLRACRTLAQDKGWTVVAEYIDEGKSARSEDISKRPKFKEMLEAAKRREFDVLVVHKLDRFARNLLTTLRCFDELSQSGITFISVSEQIDYTTPMGRVFLAMSGAFAQFYSDNLSQETKKGWSERKAQGLYCGLLPFGAMKSEAGVPIPDPNTYPGLVMAFELAGKGKADREVALALNTSGYRTAGNRGNRPFGKDSVRDMLKNQFYLGKIPDSNGGWLKGKHEPFISQELFDAVQEERTKRRHNMNTAA